MNKNNFLILLLFNCLYLFSQGNNNLENEGFRLIDQGKYLSGIKKLKKYHTTLHRDFKKAENYYEIGYAFLESRAVDSAKIYFDKGNKLADIIKSDTLFYKYHYYKANYFFASKKMDSAYIHAIKASEYAEKNNSMPQIVNTNMAIGRILLYEKSYKNAYIHLKTTLKLATYIKNGNKKPEIEALNNMGILFFEEKKLDSSLFYLNKAILLAKKEKYIRGLLVATSFQAQIHLKKGDIDKGYALSLEVLPLLNQMEYSANLDTLVQNTSKIVNLSKKEVTNDKDVKDALNLVQKNIKIQNKNGNTEIKLLQNDILLDASKNIDKFDTVSKSQIKKHFNKDARIKMLEANSRLKDSLQITTLTRNIVEYEIKYESQKKEKENLILKEENLQKKIELQKERNKKQNLIIALLLLGFILLGYIFYEIQRRKKIKSNNIYKQILIRAEERQTISKKLHDEVKNELDEIKKNPKITSANVHKIESIQNVIRNLSHQLASVNFTVLSFEDQIINLISTYDSDTLEFTLENLNEIKWKNINEAIKRNLYLIIRESIINCLKYANASSIHIQFKKEKKSITLLITDNGIGFNINSDYEGTGLRNIKTRVKELNGEFSINSIPDKGTSLKTFIILS